jgi:AcrR family transcriptional regulator
MHGKGQFLASGRDDLAITDASEGVGSFRARRGRPCQIAGPERRQLLLDAAENVFLRSGYSSASMDDIARAAGMSKKTLYRVFDTKEALFAAVVAARRATLDATIDAAECTGLDDAEAALRRFMGSIARFVLAPRQAALYRLVIAEAQRAPELAHAFYNEGPCKARAPLVDFLARLNACGTLHVSDPESAARMLFSMVIADLQMCLFVGEIGAPGDSQIEQSVTRAVDLFLRGATPRGAEK